MDGHRLFQQSDCLWIDRGPSTSWCTGHSRRRLRYTSRRQRRCRQRPQTGETEKYNNVYHHKNIRRHRKDATVRRAMNSRPVETKFFTAEKSILALMKCWDDFNRPKHYARIASNERIPTGSIIRHEEDYDVSSIISSFKPVTTEYSSKMSTHIHDDSVPMVHDDGFTTGEKTHKDQIGTKKKRGGGELGRSSSPFYCLRLEWFYFFLKAWRSLSAVWSKFCQPEWNTLCSPF